MLKVAVVIPIYNGLEYTKKTLRWLFESIAQAGEKGKAVSIVVVDDGSTDGSGEWIRANFPQVWVLKGDGNLWWTGAINMGAKYALDQMHCNYVVFWNNDIKCDINYFSNLCNLLDKADASTIIGPKIYLMDKPDVIFCMGCYFDPNTGRHTLIGASEVDSEKYSKPVRADWCAGMGTVVHKTVFLEIGFLDAQNFPQYHSDADFTLRAKKAGYKLMIYPELKIWNDKSSTGIYHKNSLKTLIQSLYSLKSNNNIAKQILFYKMHTTSPLAYLTLIKKYVGYIGGFYKWKVLRLFGIKKSNRKSFLGTVDEKISSAD